jgi:hypothetical protein
MKPISLHEKRPKRYAPLEFKILAQSSDFLGLLELQSLLKKGFLLSKSCTNSRTEIESPRISIKRNK